MAPKKQFKQEDAWLQFFHMRWMGSSTVSDMSLADQAIYLRLICLQEMYGSFPANLWQLSKLAGVDYTSIKRWYERHQLLTVYSQFTDSSPTVDRQLTDSSLANASRLLLVKRSDFAVSLGKSTPDVPPIHRENKESRERNSKAAPSPATQEEKKQPQNQPKSVSVPVVVPASKSQPESGVKVVRWSPTVLSGFMPLSEMAKRWETNLGDHTPEVVRQVCACLSDQTRERYRDYWPSRCTSAEKLVELFDQMYAEAAGVDGFSKYKPRWIRKPDPDCPNCIGTGGRQPEETKRGLRLSNCMCVRFFDAMGRERTEYEFRTWQHVELLHVTNIWPDDFPYATTRFEAAPAASAPSPKAGKKGLTPKEIYDLTTGKAR